MTKKPLVFLISLFLMLCVQATIKCPYFCSCDKWDGLRRVNCISKNLVNSEVNAPSVVQVLDLSKNFISELRESGFHNYHELKFLNMSHNKITDVHMNALKGLIQLNILDLSYNHLKVLLPKAFESVPVLQELYLSGNEIGHFGKAPVFTIPSLEVLHINECWLETLDVTTFSQLSNLMDLDLSNNQFVFLKMDYFTSLNQLNTLNLLGNPWHCNNEIQELVTKLTERNIIVTSICDVEQTKELTINTSNTFERILSAINSSDSEESDYGDIETLNRDIYVWFDTTSDAENASVRDIHGVNNEENVFMSLIENVPPLWAFILGLEIGSVVAILGMWIWLRCQCSQVPAQPSARRRTPSFTQSFRRSIGLYRAENSHYIELESTNCPGTPPPPYRDVILRTFP